MPNAFANMNTARRNGTTCIPSDTYSYFPKSTDLHDLDEFDKYLLSFLGVFLSQYHAAAPVGHLVKVGGEDRQVRTLFLVLVLRPQQHFRYLVRKEVIVKHKYFANSFSSNMSR